MLSLLMDERLKTNPGLSEKELLNFLHGLWESNEIIMSIKEDIIEYENGHSKNGMVKIKTASLRGLKDRLARAKKRLANTHTSPALNF